MSRRIRTIQINKDQVGTFHSRCFLHISGEKNEGSIDFELGVREDLAIETSKQIIAILNNVTYDVIQNPRTIGNHVESPYIEFAPMMLRLLLKAWNHPNGEIDGVAVRDLLVKLGEL